MALVAHAWTSAIANLANGTLPITNAGTTYRVILFNNSATDPVSNVNTDATMAAVKTTMGSANELASSLGGSNYTNNASAAVSGQALASVTWTRSTDVWTLTCANPQWTTAGSAFNPAYAVFFYAPSAGSTDSQCLPICWWNFNSGAAVTGGGGNYTLSVSGSGLATITGTG